MSADTADAKNTGMNWRWAIVAAVVGGTLAGCVERELVITSEPSGALVYISDVEVGRTPLRHPFTWYGDYDIILRMDGWETLKTHRNLRMPAYEVPPADLFSHLAPWTYHDTRYLHFKLEKQKPVPLFDRASKSTTVPERPPVARTIGGVP